MSPGRLLVAGLLLSFLPALAQEQPTAGMHGKVATMPSEQWNISGQSHNADPLQALMNGTGQYKGDYYEMDQHEKITLPYRVLTGSDVRVEELNDDATCYSIRSFVVARDDKDSDSTHPVSSSTCQPALKYRLQRVQVQPGPQNR